MAGPSEGPNDGKYDGEDEGEDDRKGSGAKDGAVLTILEDGLLLGLVDGSLVVACDLAIRRNQFPRMIDKTVPNLTMMNCRWRGLIDFLEKLDKMGW